MDCIAERRCRVGAGVTVVPVLLPVRSEVLVRSIAGLRPICDRGRRWMREIDEQNISEKMTQM